VAPVATDDVILFLILYCTGTHGTFTTCRISNSTPVHGHINGVASLDEGL